MANLLDLLHGNGFTLKKQASTNGGEYAGACPWCGGNDRFRVWPRTGRYWCRGCGKAGDSIQYLRDRRGLSFIEACEYLGRDPGPRPSGPRPIPAAWEPREATAPPAEWQGRAKDFLAGAVETLWSEQGATMRAWLHDEKGLSDATIKEACLGYSLTDLTASGALWGLASGISGDESRKVWLPSGIVIPLIVNGAVNRLRIRRDNPGDGARYVIASGSSSAPMTLGHDRGAAVIVESELDGLLLSQEAGDLCAVMALGSATSKTNKESHELLRAMPVILISLDTDEAGAKAAWKFWPDTYGKAARRWPCIKGKDPSEAKLNGLDLRNWIIAGLFETEEQFERFCIQTIDGGLSDREVIMAMQRGEL